MLDVVLYGYDRRKLLTLQERAFGSHRALAQFFGSDEAIAWDWAEVTITESDGRRRIVRYSAEDLLAADYRPGWNLSIN